MNEDVRRRTRVGWAVGGAVVAVVVGITLAVVLMNDDDHQISITTPGTDGSTSVVSAVSATTSGSSAVTSVTSTAGPPGPVEPSTSVVTTISVPVVVLPEPTPSLVTAGADGVWVVSGTERVQWVSEPMAQAVLLGDGVIVQRRSGFDCCGAWAAADTQLYRVASPGGPLEPFLTGVDWAMAPWLRLHDASVVDGLLLAGQREVAVRTRMTSSAALLPLEPLGRVTATGRELPMREVCIIGLLSSRKPPLGVGAL